MPVVASSEKLEFIEKVFGRSERHTKGNIQVTCPKCLKEHQKLGIQLKKKKLAINLIKDCGHCWVCGYRGRITRFLKDYAHPSFLIDYIKRFADEKTLSANIEKKPKIKDVSLPHDYKLLVLHKHRKSQIIQRALKYAYGRGLTDRDLWYFKIGVSNQWPWTDRLLFPSFNKDGDFDYMVGRSWLESPKWKYADIMEIDSTSLVFNEINIDWSKEVTITEGVFDLVNCNTNAVCLLGSDLVGYSRLFGQIVKNNTPVLLAMDADMVSKKMPGMVELFLLAGNRVRVLDLGSYEDVGSMTKEEFSKRREEAREWNNISLLQQKIDSIFSRIEI